MKLKKILSITLALLMVFSLCPYGDVLTSVSAETGITAYGKTGDCKWRLEDTKLTISGNGKMEDYYYRDDLPWNTEVAVTEVIIKSGVTHIGEYAFNGCEKLASVTIPESVISIGDSAFNNCSSLKSVTIPKGLTTIEYGAFANCSKLENITLPNSVTYIGIYAFQNCQNLKSITLPDSVTSIGSDAFYGTAYYNNKQNWKNGVLYIGKHLIVADTDTVSGNYTVTDGTITIADYAFEYCSSLKGIIIPESVLNIGEGAFMDCEELESITIPDSTIIGDGAFNGIAYYYNKQNWEDGVLYIGKNLIRADEDEISANYTIKDGTLTISLDAFEECENLESITIPDSVISIGGFAFLDCSSLKSITIPKSVISIGTNILGSCNALGSITVQEGNPTYHSSGNCIIETESKTLIQGCNTAVIPSDGSVTSISKSAFYGCGNLKNIKIPNGVKSIGMMAFAYSSSLESVVIPDSLTSIDAEAFWDCKSLKSITIPKSVKDIGYWAFTGCSEDLTIYGKYGSAAAEYAKYNSVKFVDKSHTSCNFKTTTTKATFSKNGKTVKTCKTCGNVGTTTTIYKVSSVKLSATSYIYNGKVRKPTVTVKNSKGKTLKNGTDYTLAYSNNKNVGKASVKVTLKGNYSGSKTLTFKINPKSTSLKSVAGGKKQITAKWNKQATQTTGYQIQYSTSSAFKNAKTVTVASNKTTSKIVKNLTGGKKYYVRVRTYKTVKNTKYYSAWSAKKSATAKKK